MSKESINNYITIGSLDNRASTESNTASEKTDDKDNRLSQLDSYVLAALSQEILSEKSEIEEAKFALEQSQPSHIDDPQDQARHLMKSAELTGQAVQLEKFAEYISNLMKKFDIIIEQTQEQKERTKKLYEMIQENPKSDLHQ